MDTPQHKMDDLTILGYTKIPQRKLLEYLSNNAPIHDEDYWQYCFEFVKFEDMRRTKLGQLLLK